MALIFKSKNKLSLIKASEFYKLKQKKLSEHQKFKCKKKIMQICKTFHVFVTHERYLSLE